MTFQAWKGFLPPRAIVMRPKAKRAPDPTVAPLVFTEGSPSSRLAFVGEAADDQDQIHGRPFMGPSGQLLDRMIEALGLKRSDVCLCSVPFSSGATALERQLEGIEPEVIVALGEFAAQALLQTESPITDIRGRAHEWRGRRLIPTFHPSYLLRAPDAKRDAWADLQLAARELGLQIPAKKS